MPDHKMHEQHYAILTSLSAIALLADHPYNYWRCCLQLQRDPGDPSREKMFGDSAERCEQAMQRTCELLDEVMQHLGDFVNGGDAADEHGMTDAAFAAMRRALGKPPMEGDDDDDT